MYELEYENYNPIVFLINSSKIEGRFDPYFYNSDLKKFTALKKTPIKRIREVVLSFKSGFGVGREKQSDEENGILQIRPTNLDGNGILKYDRNVYIPKELISGDNYLTEKDDILFNNTNSQELVGKTALFERNDKFAFSNHITVLKVDKTQILPKYLWLLLNIYQRHKIFYSICTNWNNQSGIGIDLLKSLSIPVPNLAQQEKISSIWNDAYKLKQQKEHKAKVLLRSIDEYLLTELGVKIPEKDNSLPNRIFTTTFSNISGNRIDPFFNEPYFLIIDEMLTKSKYPTKKLKDLCYSVRGVTYTSEDEIEDEDGIGILRANNIDLETNQLLLDDIRYIRADFEISKDKLLYKNDILMSAASGSKEHVGKVAFIEQDLDFYFGGFMSVLRVKDDSVLPQYLFSFLQSIIYRTFLFRVLGGTNINNLNFNMIANFLLPVPNDISQQKAISEKVFEIRNNIKVLRIEANEELEKARQQVEKIILEEE